MRFVIKYDASHHEYSWELDEGQQGGIFGAIAVSGGQFIKKEDCIKAIQHIKHFAAHASIHDPNPPEPRQIKVTYL